MIPFAFTIPSWRSRISYKFEYLRTYYTMEAVVEFKCHECDKPFKKKDYLKKHVNRCHNPDLVLVHCDLCDKTCKNNAELKNHKMRKHDVDVVLVYCDLCDKTCKNNSDLKSHKMFKHDVGVVLVYCDLCDKTCKDNNNLKMHNMFKHDIGMVLVYCDICNLPFKNNSILKTHKTFMHHDSVTFYPCTLCDYKAKYKPLLDRHLQYVHDQGKYECDVCHKNRNKVYKYENAMCCKTCLDRCNGESSRIEKQMSDYLDQFDTIKPYLIGSDKSFRYMGGCSLKRPDKLYYSDIIIWIECDEFAHRGSSYVCDEKRILDSLEEFEYRPVVLIRWNPHHYRRYDGEPYPNRNKRLAMLYERILYYLANPPTDTLLTVEKMFFDQE
jgi:hypothetical protein